LILIWRLSAVKDEIMLRLELVYFASFGCLFQMIYAILYLISHDWNQKDPTDVEVLYDALYLVYYYHHQFYININQNICVRIKNVSTPRNGDNVYDIVVNLRDTKFLSNT